MGTPQQRPLELILARNLLSNLATPAALTNEPGDIVFYNAAAGEFLGRPFEETIVLRVAHAYEQATCWHLRSPSCGSRDG